MFRIAVMGAVNSGKTTFVNLYVKKLEKYGRTQTLSLIDGAIGNLPVQFIDCPGHSALSYAKNISLTLADAVIYVVDSSNTNFELLTEIAFYRPVLVLFNKWQSKIPLKKHFGTSEQNTLYSELMDKCADLPLECLPFFDPNASSSLCSFPINFVSKWGVDEFEIFFKKRWVDLVKGKPKDYLYLIEDKNGYKFNSTSSHTECSYVNVGGTYNKLSYFFEYNIVDKGYTLRPEFTDSVSPLYVIDENTPPPELIKLSPEFSISKELQDLLTRSKVLELNLAIYADTPHKRQTLLQFFNKYQMNYMELKNVTFSQFRAADLENVVKVAWVDIPQDQVNYEKGFLYSDSYYNLENYLKGYLTLRLDQYVNSELVKINEEFILEFLPEYVFKRDKKDFVIGVRLLKGVLKESSYFKLKTGVQGCINSIQHEKKKRPTWNDCTKNVAVEVSFETPWVPEDGPYKAVSISLKETIQKYDSTLEKKLKQQVLEYKNLAE